MSYRWGKNPEKTSPWIEPGPAAWQARILPPAQQQWNHSPFYMAKTINFANLDIFHISFKNYRKTWLDRENWNSYLESGLFHNTNDILEIRVSRYACFIKKSWTWCFSFKDYSKTWRDSEDLKSDFVFRRDKTIRMLMFYVIANFLLYCVIRQL